MGSTNSMTVAMRCRRKVAKGLLLPDDWRGLLSCSPRSTQLGPEEDVIVVRGLDSELRLTRRTGPITPSEPFEVRTIGELFDGLPLQPALAEHPIVLVEAYIYQALVNGQAEYPVHLRTTLRFRTNPPPFDGFLPILDPERLAELQLVLAAHGSGPCTSAGGAGRPGLRGGERLRREGRRPATVAGGRSLPRAGRLSQRPGPVSRHLPLLPRPDRCRRSSTAHLHAARSIARLGRRRRLHRDHRRSTGAWTS